MLTGPLHRFLVRMPSHDWNANDRAEAAKVIGDVGQKAVDEVEGGRFGDLPIDAFVRGKNVILPQGTTVTVQSPRDFRIEATGS